MRFIIINRQVRKEMQNFFRFLACFAVNRTKSMIEKET